jgi:hypothetical protein
MEKSESIKELTQSVIKVMAGCKGIEKTLTVGTGSGSYKGVADKDVKSVIGELMESNGLAIFPTGITELTQIDGWEETGQYGVKHKQSIFTRVTTTYLLCHVSGEWIELKGYGHGVDSQDKSAGKATTYALKYALLYAFMVPTGKIDDADNSHSEEIKAPVKPPVKTPAKKQALTPIHENWQKVIDYLKGTGTMTEVLKKYEVSKEFQEKLINETLKNE